MNRDKLTVLSISFYGADMARGGKYSGALDRQRDYARMLDSLIVLVPGSDDAVATREERLIVRSLGARGQLAFFFRAYQAACELAKSTDIDLIMVDNPHIAGILGLILRARLGKPLIVHSMGDMLRNPWYRKERFSNRIKELVMRIVFRFTDAYRVSTSHEISRLSSCGYDITKVVSVPFYIDYERFRESVATSSAPRKAGRALFVGRLGYQKDVATLFRAFALSHKQHPASRLVIVGDGPLRAALEDLARNLGVSESIDFKGSIPYEHVAEEFAQASLFVLPSLYEGTCMVLHEAAVAQLPIVSTDNAGAVDFIGDTKAGWLVPVGDVSSMAKALTEAFSDEAACVARGAIAHDRLSLFTKEKSLMAFERLIECSILRGKRV